MIATLSKINLPMMLVLKALKPMKKGRLKLYLPSGELHLFGDEANGHQAEIVIHDQKLFTKLILGGDLALGDTYQEGLWDTPNLTAVIEWFILNIEQGVSISGTQRKGWIPVNILKAVYTLQHRLRDNTLQGARKNIEAHYDLSNQMYKLFLDDTMAYSSALFTKNDLTLKEAQLEKFRRLCMELRLQETDHLLEIGSGWGGLALFAAQNYGCRVTTVTISKEQFDYCQNLFKNMKVDHLIEVKFQDYRLITGKYDKLVSVEMIEAVGHKHFKSFFQQCQNLLKPNGLLAIQAITYPHARYQEYLNGVDWIQKEIFPGGHLPSVALLTEGLSRYGNFELINLFDMAKDYAKTLHLWREKFELKKEELHKLKFEENFIRKWRYYFSYCEAGFKSRNVSVVQMIFARPNTAY